jgi:hypothetical protein
MDIDTGFALIQGRLIMPSEDRARLAIGSLSQQSTNKTAAFDIFF